MSMRLLTQRAAQVQPSMTLAVNAKAQAMRASGIDVQNLTAGEPDTIPAAHIMEAATRAMKERKHYYTPSAGVSVLREAVANKCVRVNGLATTPEQVVVTNGGKEALYLLFQTLLEPGDEVIIASPTWVSFGEQIRLAGGVPVPVRVDERFHLTAELIAPHITDRTVALVVNSPANPTGAVLSCEELEAIALLARERDLWVIADEVYEEFLYDGLTHVSIGSLPDMGERTITVNACSKTYSMTGWRVGYISGPQEVMTGVARMKDHVSSNVNSVAQYAALAALTGPQEQVAEMRAQFTARRTVLVEGLQRLDGWSFAPPEGAFYAFIDIGGFMEKRGLSDSVAACEWLLEHAQVALVPGQAFGSEWTTFVRWSFAADRAVIEEALERLSRL